MNFLTANHTDVGTRKKSNQDSMLVMQADTDKGQVLLASVCDGMGGLAKGEVASAAMVRIIQDWFANRLPHLLAEDFVPDKLYQDWNELIHSANSKIMAYGRGIHADLGTTCVILLIVGNNYYTLNVGDSRVYWLTDNIYQLTKDQTFVQRELDLGHITVEQAYSHPNRSVLLQCIGASNTVKPEFGSGQTGPGQVFMLCCDGFRHVVLPQEFYDSLNPYVLTNQDVMKEKLDYLIKLNIRRGEVDNISAVLVRTY